MLFRSDEMIAERIKIGQSKNAEIQPEWLEVDIENLARMRRESTTVRFPHITDKIVIGDSHAICMHRPGWTVNSVPFKTLNGALNTGLQTFIEEVRPIFNVTSLECYFGNIDVRHHLCRIEGDPIQNARKLAMRYVDAVVALPISKKAIYELLPIENESRKLPQTGYYKGKPFWGKWNEREAVRREFNDTCEELCKCHDVEFIHWTNYLLNDKGELDFKYMEKPHSIHLSREFYPHWNGSEHFGGPSKKSNKSIQNIEPAVETGSLLEFF